jgi:hypothetical protein
MAARLGLDYDRAVLLPPQSDSELAMSAILCCTSLLYGFTYRDEWPSEGLGSVDSGTRRRAARYLARALETDVGRDGIALVTRRFADGMAAFWRAAVDQPEFEGDSERLRANALASIRMGRLVSRAYPVGGYEAVLGAVQHADEGRQYDADKPGALVDLQHYARRMRATAEGLAVAMSERFADFEEAITGPLWHFNLVADAASNANWAYVAPLWNNLVSPSPMSNHEAARAAGYTSEIA